MMALALGVFAATSVVAGLAGASIFRFQKDPPRAIELDLEVHKAPAPLIFASAHPYWSARIDGVNMPIEVVPSGTKSEIRVFLDTAPEGLGHIELFPLDAPESEPDDDERAFTIPYKRQFIKHLGGASPLITEVGQGLVRTYLEKTTADWEKKAKASLPHEKWCGVGFEDVTFEAELVNGKIRTQAILLGSQGLRAKLTLWPEARIDEASRFVLQLDPNSIDLDINTPRFVSDGTTTCDTLANASEVLPWMVGPVIAGMESATSTMVEKFEPISITSSFRTRTGPLRLVNLDFKPRHLELEGHLDMYGGVEPLLKESSRPVREHQRWLETLSPLAPNGLRTSAPLDVVNALLSQIATGETSKAWFEAKYPNGIVLQKSLQASSCQLDAPLHLSRSNDSLVLRVPLARCLLTVTANGPEGALKESQYYIFFNVDAPVQAGHDRLLWRWSTSAVEPLCAPKDNVDRLDRCEALGLDHKTFIEALRRMLPSSTLLGELTNQIMLEGVNVDDASEIRLWSERKASGWLVLEFNWEKPPRALVDAIENSVR